MKYAVDRIENNIAVLENINNNDILEVNISDLPNNIKSSDILVLKNGMFTLDNNEKEERLKRIQDKFNRLKKQ